MPWTSVVWRRQCAQVYELGLLKDIPGIYTLDFDKIAELEGYGRNPSTNLRAAIDHSA